MVKLKDILVMTQTELHQFLNNHFQAVTDDITDCPGKFLFIKGTAPVLLVAHLDTVHKTPPHIMCESEGGNYLMSPCGIGGDDRCGVYALLQTYSTCKQKPSLLFTHDEETGGNGARAFSAWSSGCVGKSALPQFKYIIEIDRRGKDDAVYYDCANYQFENFISSFGFKTQFGSFSDISIIAPALGIAAVNLSSGYYNEHTIGEYINVGQLNDTIQKIINLVNESVKDNIPTFEYIEDPAGMYPTLHDSIESVGFNKEYIDSLMTCYVQPQSSIQELAFEEKYEILESCGLTYEDIDYAFDTYGEESLDYLVATLLDL